MTQLISRQFVTACIILTIFIASGCGGSESSPAPADAGAAGPEAQPMAEPHAEDHVDDHGDMNMDENAQMEAEMMAANEGMEPEMNGEMDSSQYDAEMEAQMAAGMSGSDPAMMQQYGNSMPNTMVPKRSPDVANWSETDLLEAVVERDAAVLTAIRSRAEAMKGDPKFVATMTQVLMASSGGAAALKTGAPGEPGFPRGIDPSALPTGDQRPVPPGGASRAPELTKPPALRSRAITSMEALLGEAMLGYVPQATQAIRDRVDGIPGVPNQNSANGNDAGMDAMEMELQQSMDGMSPQDFGSGSPDGMSQRPTGNLTDAELLETVVAALVINNTDKAWDVILKLVQGRIPSAVPEDEKQAIVVKSISEASTLNEDAAKDILKHSIDASLGNSTAPALKMLTVVGGKAADHYFRLSHPPTDPQTTNGQPATSNTGMMDAGMQFDSMPPQMEQFNGGADMNGGFFPNGQQSATGTADLPEVNVTTAAMQPIAASLWSQEVVDNIAGQLDAADASTSIDLLSVATVIPSDKVRHSMYGLFSRLHELGATGMIQAGLFTNIAKDPGILNVIKALPRSRPTQASTRPGGQAVAADPKESWADASLNLVLALRERLKSVEMNSELRFNGRQPVPLHGRGVIPDLAMAIETLSPDADALNDAQPSKTLIYYTRLTVSPQTLLEMKDIADHYEKRANGIKHELPDRGILWYDGVKKGADGTRHSMDVIIQQAGAAATNAFQPVAEPGTIGGAVPQQVSGGGSGQRFTIEIIVVQTRDPKEIPLKADVAAN